MDIMNKDDYLDMGWVVFMRAETLLGYESYIELYKDFLGEEDLKSIIENTTVYGNQAQGIIINLLAESLNGAFNIHMLGRDNYILETY